MRTMIRHRYLLIPICAALAAILACNTPASPPPSPSSPAISEALSPIPLASAATIPATVPPTPTSTLSPTVALTATPEGCERPPDDYTRVTLRDSIVLNQRTIWMLEHAQTLYGGTHDFLLAVTQGS